MITISKNRVLGVALWSKAQSAMISQGDFFNILNKQGPTALLALCAERGVFKLTKPAISEMNFEHMLYQNYYTNNNLFFTYCHGKPVEADIKDWTLSIEGDGLDNPFSLNYDELLKLPVTTVIRYLECAGNGRIFFDTLLNKKAKGEQWHLGGWGLAEWTGVRLSALLKKAKIRKEAVEVMTVGLDDPRWEMPVPVGKALEDDTLLAYIMNGEILPPDHGFPLRTVVPGWVGGYSVKWLTKIIVSTRPIKAASRTKDYVLSGPNYAPQSFSKGEVISNQVVKSACCIPWPASLKAGHQDITGYAWSPFGKIAKVEISLDGGKTFFPAALTGPNIERAGTRWKFCFHAEAGELTITPRATDDQGNTQWEISKQKWNRGGYLFGACAPHPVTVPKTGGESYSVINTNDIIPSAGCC